MLHFLKVLKRSRNAWCVNDQNKLLRRSASCGLQVGTWYVVVDDCSVEIEIAIQLPIDEITGERPLSVTAAICVVHSACGDGVLRNRQNGIVRESKRKHHPAPGGAGPFSRLWVAHKSWPLRSLVVLERE